MAEGLTPEQKDVVYFGRANFRNENKLFGIKRKDRRQHMYVIGKSGTGKSAMISNMIMQDIVNGEGVCVVDPHGELIEEIVRQMPEDRVKDVVYFNPADTDYHLGFNVLELPDLRYKHLVASGLMSIFTKIWANVWSARMEYIMNNAILALLDTPGSTLLGITRILVDKDYRQKVVANITDPVVKAFWIHEYEEWQDKFRNEAIAPIQNKVGQFLSTALIRNVVGQSKSTIDIYDIMNSQKIFLVNVSKGRIGEDNSALLGAMLITKIQLSAMERVRIAEDQRKDFYLYVDEFQNFATDSFASILSEARKYRLNLILAHQYIGQLETDTSTKVRDAVFGNVGTMAMFRVGATDAIFLEKEFEPEFTPPDLIQLPNYNIYIKLLVNGVSSRPFSASTLPPFHFKTIPGIEELVIQTSRKLYARPRKQVEDEINRWSGMQIGEFSGPDFSGGGTVEEAPRKPFARREGGGPREGFAPAPRRTDRAEIQRKAQHVADLAALGIEFSAAPGGGSAPSERHVKKFERGDARGGGEARQTPPETPPMKLKDLGRGATKHHKPESSHLHELRSALKDVLGVAHTDDNKEDSTDGGRDGSVPKTP